MSGFLSYVKAFFATIFSKNVLNPNEYIRVYAEYQPQFGVPGTIMFVIFVLVGVAFLTSAVLLIIWGIRKIFRNTGKGLNEQKMKEEIERLNLELYDVTREKDRILALSREADGVYSPVIEPGGGSGGMTKLDDKAAGGRFAKLYVVDEKYK